MLKDNIPFKSSWVLVSGVLLVVFGLYILFHPASALLALALYIGVIFIAVGCAYMMAFLSWNHTGHLALALLDIFIGIILVSNLGITVASIPIIFALWSLFVGVIQISTSLQLKKISFPWLLPMISGSVGVLFAFLIMGYPIIGAVAITFFIGSYIILYGVMTIIEYKINKIKY